MLGGPQSWSGFKRLKEKILSNLDHPVVQPIARHYTEFIYSFIYKPKWNLF
jgi:hypothetical protein